MCTSVFARAKTDTRAPLERPRYLRGAYIMNHKKLLLTLTLCLCALLCMVVTASAAEVQEHSHPVCAGTECTDPAHNGNNHGSVTFATELRQDGNTLYIGADEWEYDNNWGGYMLGAGTYYLSTDLTLDHRIQISDSNGGSVVLCLNGKTISCTTGKTIQIKSMKSKDLTFTLCDCKGGGMITHAEDSGNGSGVDVAYSGNINNTDVAKFIMYNGCITQNKGSGVYLNANTAFTMYGGSITQNGYNDTSIFGGYGGGVYVASEASFTMYGGNITGNYANKNGGGVYVNADKTFVMYGGSITGNHTAGSGGGVNVNAGTITVGGNVNISGNWQGNENSSISNNNANNVYLSAYDSSSKFATITIEKALTGAPIGVTTANAPTAGNPVTIVTGNSIEEAYKARFQADNAAYGVSYNSTDKVLQLHKHSGGTATCTAEAVCTTCGQSYGNRNPNNHDYSQTRMTPTYKASDATCTTPVTYYYSCVCGAKGTNTFDSTKEDEQAKGHAFAAAWEHNDDKHWHKCTRDGCTGIDAEAAHTYGGTWVKGQDGHWKVCEVCQNRSEVEPHNWRDATTSAPKTCAVCGATTGTKLSAYYYYSPAKTEDTPVSPKAGDPGVLLYAGLALASLTGLACTAKKRH